MKYLAFKEKLSPFSLFSLNDARKAFPNLDIRRLSEWQQKGYIQKIRRGYYRFTDQPFFELKLFEAANKLYSPSYVSLESAFRFYNIIPEGVFSVYSVTTKNTQQYHTPIGAFKYRNLKTNLFFGYSIIKNEEATFKMAHLEKALLDYLYLNPVNDIESLSGLRLNIELLEERLNFSTLESYLSIFDSKTLSNKISTLLTHLHA